MKRLLLILASACWALASCAEKPEEQEQEPQTSETRTVRLMSFNVRSWWCDGEDASLGFGWDTRKGPCVALINDYAPDVIGFNECKFDKQMPFMRDTLKNYTFLEDAADDGDSNYIFYRTSSVRPVKGTSGKFWLSATPDEPSSGWTGADTYRRTCLYCQFECIDTGNRFWFFLTHPASGSAFDVLYGLKLIASRMARIASDGAPVFIGGDLNCQEDSAPLIALRRTMAVAREVAPVTDDKPTYNDWGEKATCLDFILAKGPAEILRYETVDRKYGGVEFVSDHYPIVVDAKIGVDADLEIPPVSILDRENYSGNISSFSCGSTGQFTILDAGLFDEPVTVKAMKIGTADSPGTFSLYPARTGDCTLSFFANAWRNASSILVVSVSGGALTNGQSCAEIRPRPVVASSTPLLNPLAADKYSFELTGLSADSVITLSTRKDESSGTSEYRSVVLGLNLDGGDPLSGGSVVAPIFPAPDSKPLF